MANADKQLASLSRGFRSSYLTYDELTAQVHAWAETFPELVRVSSIGRSSEGRELWLLTIGPEPDRLRPAAWVDGNMHATEVTGCSAALAIAEDVIRLHLSPDAELHGLPAHMRKHLRNVLFYVLPRMSPDGAEAVLKTGRYVRSVPRLERPDRGRSYWRSEDVDGDGLTMLMRKEDPTGEFVEAREFPGLLVKRRLEDAGPFYKLYGEGSIENWDGSTIPTPSYLSDTDTDLNRNFPYHWAPDPDQLGAGQHALSAPESRAVVDFATKHPNIFTWLNLHTFGGCFIRPLGDAPDHKMDQDELAIFREIGEFGEAITGYPMVSGFEEFLYEPEKPLHGDLVDYVYRQRGAIAYVCELWDLFKQAGATRKKKFVDYYSHLTRDEIIGVAKWDREHNKGRVIRPWKKFEHPQLGTVEIGGVDARVGISNPPYELLPDVVTKQSAMYLRVAAMAPRVEATARVVPLEGDTTRIDVDIRNVGYLPTYGIPTAKRLPWNEPLWIDAVARGCTLATPSEAHREVGHLDGWGRGLYDGTGGMSFMRGRGNTSQRVLSYVVRGRGALELRITSCRTGVCSVIVEL